MGPSLCPPASKPLVPEHRPLPGLGGRPCLPDPGEEGDGTPGPCTGGPGPPTASPGPVAARERADVGAPQEAGALRPRNQPGQRAGQSPGERARSRARGGPGQPDRPETQPQPEREPGRAAQGAARRAGRTGRGWPPGTHPRRGCASRGRGPQSRGLMAGGGPGRRPHIPPVAGGCRATVRRREEGRGPGGGGPWQPGRPGRMTMEGNALSESESGPRGRGGRGPALAALGHTTRASLSSTQPGGRHRSRRGAAHRPGGSAEPGTRDAAGPARGRGSPSRRAALRPAHNSRKPRYLSARTRAYTAYTGVHPCLHKPGCFTLRGRTPVHTSTHLSQRGQRYTQGEQGTLGVSSKESQTDTPAPS